MRPLTPPKPFLLPALTTASLLVGAATAAAAPLTVGDTGTVGNQYLWNASTFRSVDAASTTAAGYSFTAFEDTAIDAVYQRIQNLGSDTESLVVQLRADNAGLPGAVLATTTVNVSASQTVQADFGSSINLNAGNVYHVTVANDAVGSDVGFRLFHSSGNQSVRPSDHRVDNAMNVLQADSGGNFSVINRDPYFYVSNGGNPVSGIGQSINLRSAGNSIRSFSNGGALEGQLFQITENEVEAGNFFSTETISLGLTRNAAGNLPDDFFVRLRSADGTILASSSVATAGLATSGSPFDGSPTVFTLDNIVDLEVGVDYLITTDFGGIETASAADFIRIQATLSGLGGADPNEEEGNYLATDGFVIRSANDWATFGGFGRNEFDFVFALGGEVTAIPEPASLVLLGLGGLLVAGRRRRG